MTQKRRISILGSTGSIGQSAVALLSSELRDKFEVVGLTAHSNVELLIAQANLLKAKVILCTSGELDGSKISNLLHPGCKILNGNGKNSISDLLEFDCAQNGKLDVILSAIVSIHGLLPTIDAIKSCKVLALANKESIVCGWHILKPLAKMCQTKIIPVDSEHNSLFRLLAGQSDYNLKSISKISITASGGPFYGKKFADLSSMRTSDVARHPVWSMGAKISIDSATMANKGLELIEACNVFEFPENNIEVCINRESIVHGAVHFTDGTTTAFLSKPDMKCHISHAICDGDIASLSATSPNLLGLKKLEFFELEEQSFPIFFIAKAIASDRDIAKAILFNIANDIAVAKFMREQIKYTQILSEIERGISKNITSINLQSADDIHSLFMESSN